MKDYAKKIFSQNIEKFNTNVGNVTKYGDLPFPEKTDENIYEKSTRNAPALLSNTGGTTGGFPKIVVTSAYKINFLIRKNYNELFAKRFKIHSREIGLTDLPLTSAVAPTYCLHLGLCYADKYVILPTELPEIKFEIMTQNNITFYITHHSIIGKMIPYKDLCINAFRHLKMLFMNVTAPCDELKENTMKLLPDKCVCADSYGITEMICVTLQRYGKDMGYQIFGGSNLIKDINSNKLLPPFEKGELLIDSEYVMDGYLDGDADKNAFIVITNDVSRNDHNNNAVTGGKRYLRTGDIGYIDEKGLFYYIDRLKRIDRIGGYSIFPAVIENTIMKNKNVINCVVARKKDKNNKPFLTAYLQINGVGDFTQTANDIKADILKNLGKYNVPRQFVFADKIEQTPAGKNNYRYYENSED
jgi:acyl-CoA synthetase (AMP-forming)/AMP-acid ligase II